MSDLVPRSNGPTLGGQSIAAVDSITQALFVNRPRVKERATKMYPNIVTTLPPTAAASSTTELFKQFSLGMGKLAPWQAENSRFLKQVLATSMEIRESVYLGWDWVEDRCEEMLQKSGALAATTMLPAIGVEEAKRPLSSLYSLMSTTLWNACLQVAGAVYYGLEVFSKQEFTGRIEWKSRDTCRYWFYKWIVEEKMVGWRETDNGDEVEDLEQKLLHGVHVHDVIKASSVPVDRLTEQVRRTIPHNVNLLINTIPEYMREEAHVVAGDEIFRSVMERELGRQQRSVRVPGSAPAATQTNSFRADPALVIGDVVIAGW